MAITEEEQTFFNNAINKVFSYDIDDLRYAQKLLTQYSDNVPELLIKLDKLCGCSFSTKAGLENISPPQAVADSISEAGEYEYSTTSKSKYWGSALSTKLAWQAAIGGTISITKSIDANIEYAYIDRGKFRTKNGYKQVFPDGETTYENSESKVGYLREQAVTLGIKYKF